jgi:hypothetical protein
VSPDSLRAVPLALLLLLGAGCGYAPYGSGAGAHPEGTARPAPHCEAVPRGGAAPDADLYCIVLVPAPGHRGAAGGAMMMPARSPFGVAVTRDGAHVYDVTVAVDALPDPASLGALEYVAWATTPRLSPWIRLGSVSPGRPAAGRVDFDKFLVFVSAESDPGATERTGPLVLRGASPSMRMLPADDPVLLMGAATPDADAGHAAHGDHATGAAAPPSPTDPHVHHGGTPAGGSPPLRPVPWIMPPEDTALFMPPGMMALRPTVAGWLPDTTGRGPVPAVRPREVIRLRDGDSIALAAGLVSRTIAGRPLVMYGFNGQHPGPLLQVTEGATVVVNFTNHLELPTAVHWHGVRLDNRFDGVPHVTQDPVEPGGSFRYVVHFRDPGIYWYHPHRPRRLRRLRPGAPRGGARPR